MSHHVCHTSIIDKKILLLEYSILLSVKGSKDEIKEKLNGKLETRRLRQDWKGAQTSSASHES